jgi:hypothetical protein
MLVSRFRGAGETTRNGGQGRLSLFALSFSLKRKWATARNGDDTAVGVEWMLVFGFQVS